MNVYVYIHIYTHNGVLFSQNKILPFAAMWMGLEIKMMS